MCLFVNRVHTSSIEYGKLRNSARVTVPSTWNKGIETEMPRAFLVKVMLGLVGPSGFFLAPTFHSAIKMSSDVSAIIVEASFEPKYYSYCS